MITVIHQPDFMPWMGYLIKIQNSNLLIYLDDVQFQEEDGHIEIKFEITIIIHVDCADRKK